MGHVLFSKIDLMFSNRECKSLSLAPVAVLPEFQKRGIGNSLIRAGLDQAVKLGYESILVLGDPKYYGRFGFRHAFTKNIKSAYNCAEYMGMELVPGSLSGDAPGIVEYPNAFLLV